MNDKLLSVALAFIVIFSGVNSAVLVTHVNIPHHITVAVDPATFAEHSVPPPAPVPEHNALAATTSDRKQTPTTHNTLKETFADLATLFDRNSYLIVGEKAESPDVLGAANISYALAWGGCTHNPQSRTDTLLTPTEHDTGNLIVVGGPSVNEIAVELGKLLRITYEYSSDESFKINAETKSIYLDLQKYPQEDICIVYLREYRGQNILMVWGYGWQGTLAGSIFVANPETWKDYKDCRMVMLRWKDNNKDGLIQHSEIAVEDSLKGG